MEIYNLRVITTPPLLHRLPRRAVIDDQAHHALHVLPMESLEEKAGMQSS